MSDYLIKGTTLSGIADVIRSKTGKSDPVPVTSMADEIATLSEDLTEEIEAQDIDLLDLEAQLNDLEDKEDLAEEILIQNIDLLDLEAELNGLENKEDLTEELMSQDEVLSDLETEINNL